MSHLEHIYKIRRANKPPDVDGFNKHLEELDKLGVPRSLRDLVMLAVIYNVYIPPKYRYKLKWWN